jgi:hypothetical protein
MITYSHRDGVDQYATTELNHFYNKLKAALLVTVSECVIPWSICVPSFGKYAIWSGTRQSGIIDSDKSEGENMEGSVN